MPYVQGVYSDVVLNTSGQPVPNATVTLYSVGQWATGVLPTGSPPSPAPSGATVATATTDATGSFSLRNLPVDDYHVLVTYTPPGGAQVVLWRYNVSVGPEGLTLRAFKRGLGATQRRFLAKLLAGQNVTICCIGDGVTVGYNATGTVSGGWVARLASRIAAALPSAQVLRYDPNSYGTTSDAPIPSWTSVSVQAGTTQYGLLQSISVINAGVTSDTTLRAIRRLNNFTSANWSPPPDLYVISLGLGEMASDGTRAATPADFAGHLTGLVNLLRANGAEALILTPHANATVSNCDDYCAAARGVAAATGCGLVDVRQLWLDHYLATAPNDGYDPWLSTSGGDHTNPTDAGHQAIGDEVFRAFDVANLEPVAGPAGVGTELERVRLLNTAPTPLVFTGTWSAFTWANDASGQEMQTSTAGATVTFKARFCDLYMLCRRWKDSGQVTVTVDGAGYGTVELYRANPASTVDVADYNTAIAPQERVLLAQGLADTVHTVTLALAATHNPSSSGYMWRFDAIELVRQRQAAQVMETVAPLQKVQTGTVNVSLSAQNNASAAVAFPQAFVNTVPTVVVSVEGTGNLYICELSARTLTGFTVNVFTRDASNQTATVTVDWIAVGS